MTTSSLAKDAEKMRSKLAHEVTRERDRHFSKPNGTTSKKDDPIDELVRLAAAGVGFVSEALHHRKEKKRAREEAKSNQPEQPESATFPEQLNEAAWALDDAEQEAAANETELNSPKEPKDLAEAFLARHPPPPVADTDAQLALPVLLVQRRPKDRSRGFIRCYAPALADVGIDQETFIDFIDTLNKSLEPNPWLYAINLAGIAGSELPEPMMMFFGAAVGIVAETAMEAQSRFKSNTFLDHINAQFFIPRGLISLVVTWKPGVSDNETVTAVDFDGRAVLSRSETNLVQTTKDVVRQKILTKDGSRQIQEQMQHVIKSSNGIINAAEPAPLIFPTLDEIAGAQKDGDKKKKNAVDRSEKWIDEYMDKRAQAKWIEKNPDLPATNMVPRAEFRSRYADPNHPAASGDIVAFLTGGHWKYGHGKSDSVKPKEEKVDVKRHKSDEPLESTEAQRQSRSSESNPKTSKDESKTSKDSSSKSQKDGLTSLLQQVRDIPRSQSAC